MSKHLGEVATIVPVAEVYIFCGDLMLMDKRSTTKKKFPGFWSVPGGHIDEGDDPLAAAIREVKEETGVTISAKDIRLKAVTLHHHIDRHEIYSAYLFSVSIAGDPPTLLASDEGEPHWVPKSEILQKNNLFPPVKHYLERIIKDEPGIVYNYSRWENSQLVETLSETVDKNG